MIYRLSEEGVGSIVGGSDTRDVLAVLLKPFYREESLPDYRAFIQHRARFRWSYYPRHFFGDSRYSLGSITKFHHYKKFSVGIYYLGHGSSTLEWVEA